MHFCNAHRVLPLPLGEVPRRGGEGVLSYGGTPSQSKIRDFCQLSQRESQGVWILSVIFVGGGFPAPQWNVAP